MKHLSFNKNKKDEEIIFEGELLKYKPGLNFNYVKRWCQLTKKKFKLKKESFK